MKKICKEQDCQRDFWAKDYCQYHYSKFKMDSVSEEELLTRKCIKCGRGHPEVMFQGYRKQCNSCAYRRYSDKHRNHNLKKNYGLSSEKYDEILQKQGGKCAICKTESPGGRSGKFFHVDHNHITGKVRGLLCAGCNIAIGHLKESPSIARNLASYLEDHSER